MSGSLKIFREDEEADEGASQGYRRDIYLRVYPINA